MPSLLAPFFCSTTFNVWRSRRLAITGAVVLIQRPTGSVSMVLHLSGPLFTSLALCHLFILVDCVVYVTPRGEMAAILKILFFKCSLWSCMPPPPLHPPTCGSALTCHATIAWSVLHHTLLMACFKVTGAYCCERGRREVASVGTKDRRSLVHILSSFHILRLTLILVPLLSPFFSPTNMSTARLISSRHNAFPSCLTHHIGPCVFVSSCFLIYIHKKISFYRIPHLPPTFPTSPSLSPPV